PDAYCHAGQPSHVGERVARPEILTISSRTQPIRSRDASLSARCRRTRRVTTVATLSEGERGVAVLRVGARDCCPEGRTCPVVRRGGTVGGKPGRAGVVVRRARMGLIAIA